MVRGKHGDTREITKKDTCQHRVLHVSMFCLAFWLSWEHRVQGMNPREIKYSKEQILEKCVDPITNGTTRKLILNDIIKIAHERSVNET